MDTIVLTRDELGAVDEVVDEVVARFDTVEDPDFHLRSRTFAEDLPRRLRDAVNTFRLAERPGVLVVSGPTVDDVAIGHTPRHWRTDRAARPTLRHDVAFFLVASLLGDPVGWATQQDGRIMHDVFPIAEHTDEQIGWGSAQTLDWHTEDAFHPLRADYLGLSCLRNPDHVETTVCDVADLDLDDRTREMLGAARFRVLPDNSHRPENAGDENGADDPRVTELRRRSEDRVDRALHDPEPVPVLFGDPADPYLRIDPYYMRDVQGEQEQRALDVACAATEAALTGVVLEPGDMCFLDNFRVVHGRKPFTARFDGTDRWLRRLNITRDLRKSRAARLEALSRVIY